MGAVPHPAQARLTRAGRPCCLHMLGSGPWAASWAKLPETQRWFVAADRHRGTLQRGARGFLVVSVQSSLRDSWQSSEEGQELPGTPAQPSPRVWPAVTHLCGLCQRQQGLGGSLLPVPGLGFQHLALEAAAQLAKHRQHCWVTQGADHLVLPALDPCPAATPGPPPCSLCCPWAQVRRLVGRARRGDPASLVLSLWAFVVGSGLAAPGRRCAWLHLTCCEQVESTVEIFSSSDTSHEPCSCQTEQVTLSLGRTFQARGRAVQLQ